MEALLLIFLLNLITSAMSQLKYMLASKNNSWEMYLLIGLDSIFYMYSLTLVIGKNNSLLGIAVLTTGKLLGVTVANFIEKRFVSKIYLYNYYLSDKTLLTELEDFAESNSLSMSTTTTKFKDIERFTVTMHVNKKQEKLVNNFFKRKNVKPTADCLLVSKTFGNIEDRVS